MWPFTHKHDLQLVAATYSPPIDLCDAPLFLDETLQARIAVGSTSFIWKCADPNCTKVVLTVALGKEER